METIRPMQENPCEIEATVNTVVLEFVALEMMRSIKRALEPSNLMNPGRRWRRCFEYG